MAAKVAVIAPTPAPYRAWEYDYLQRKLGADFSFHLMFMERSWQEIKWGDDVPRLATWEALPRMSLGPLNRLPMLHRTNRGTRRRLDVLRPDAIILHGWDAPAIWTACRWAKRHGAGLLLRTDSNYLRELTRPPGFKTRLRHALLTRFLRQIGAFLTIGTNNEKYYQMYGADPARFFRSSYMVDTQVFARHADDQRSAGRTLKQELGIREQFVVAFVGRLIPLKGLEILVQAFLKGGSRFEDVALLLIGDGPEKGRLQQLAAPLGNRVHFCGFREPQEIGRLFGISDVLVLPSYWEAWGMVVTEAMAAGLPVVTSDQVGSAEDLVVPGTTGDVFVKGEVDGLLKSLSNVLFGSPGPAEMGRAARLRLEEWNSEFDVAEGFGRALTFVTNRQRR